MILETALRIQKLLTEKYLFANTRVLEYAGGYEDDPEEDFNDYLLDAFRHIDAVAISHSDRLGHFLQLLATDKGMRINPLQISEYCGVSENEIRISYTDPIKFHSSKSPRTLKIGSSVSHIASSTYGTLGCFVSDERGNKYLLSNYHVLFNAGARYDEDFIIQPGKPHGKASDVVGILAGRLPFDPLEENLYDAALAGPLNTNINSRIRRSFFHVVEVSDHTDVVLNEKVYKCGASSKVTFGEVDAFLTNIKVAWNGTKIAFRNQIVVKGLNRAFSEPGDSGSIVINNANQAVGLLFAGNTQISLANPIGSVLAGLKVNLCCL